MDLFSLDNKTALVVGGGSGIGEAIARGFAEAGAKVAVASRTLSKVEAVRDSIIASGGTATAAAIDVCDSSSVESAINGVVAEFASIDILVNSAGTHIKKPSMEMTDTDWNGVMETNLAGTFRLCRSAGRVMAAQGGGSIINIASINGIAPFPETAAYCVSKSGVIMLTRSLAAEWAHLGIRVNAIAPGVAPTELNASALKTPGRVESIVARTPMGALAETRDFVGAAIYLASPASSFVTGETITVDGGLLAKTI